VEEGDVIGEERRPDGVEGACSATPLHHVLPLTACTMPASLGPRLILSPLRSSLILSSFSMPQFLAETHWKVRGGEFAYRIFWQ
jgi:hypothetical protein